ncbi:tetratricopeptide repeat protein [Hydrocarboniclastica marina]|uniref:Uncharacterized protein n=1 Tax=Hydrocarboniclastica marina TaxID=2259620 RepID=A0A4P7XHW6_9ALTE|nr:tetratricopeptide repeat protein [Hydrocarboniclastica marina]QCF26273.1 hypothetical protein soil367_10195 [Hydrocarboniclastica marina]
MTAKRAIQASILAAALSFGLAGCNSSEELSQEEARFLSHIDQAKFYQRQGELKASTQEARNAMDLLPTHIEPYLLIIDNLVKAGDGASVERQIATLRERIEDGAIEQHTENKLHLMLARGHYLQGEFEQAQASLSQIKEPSSSQKLEATLIRGEMALAERDLDKAREIFTTAREQDNQDVMPLVGLSKTAFHNGERDKARDLMAQAEELDSTDTELWLWKAQMAQEEERWEDARQGYEKALEDIGQYDVMTFRKYETISSLIEVLRAQNKAQEAFVYEEILAKSGPGTLRSNFIAAQEMYEEGDLEGAARALEEILAQAATHERAQLMLGLIRFQQGRPKEAEQLLESLASLNNDDASRLLAATKLQLRQPEAARELLDNIDENETNPGTLALVGMASLASGDHDTGRRYIERSLELDPDNTELRIRYARYLASRENMSGAIDQLKTAIGRTPDSENAFLTLARLQAAQQNTADAAQTLEKWRKAHPDSIRALISSGDLAASQGENQRARQYYQQALQKAPEDISARVALGNLARRNDDPAGALEHFKAALEIQPNSREALRGLVQVSRGDEARYQETLKWLSDLGEAKPEAIGPKLVLMEDALTKGEFERAESVASAIVNMADAPTEAEPLLSSLYTTVAQQALREENQERATKVLEQGRERFPDNENLALMTSRLYLNQGKEDQALDIISEVKKSNPASATPFLLEAEYRVENEEFEKAANLFELALEKDDNPETILKLSSALRRDRQPSKAIEVLETGANRHQNNAQIQLALAIGYQGTDETGKAQQAYETLLKLAPNNPVALNNLAWIYHEQDDDRATDLAKRAYELNPRSAAIADTYGWILFSTGKVEESLPVLESAYELAPTAEEIALHLAEVYKATNQDDKARSVLEKI